jgi:hypothetical protein
LAACEISGLTFESHWLKLPFFMSVASYFIVSVFHRFKQAKFPFGGSIFATAPVASKNDTRYKSGQN